MVILEMLHVTVFAEITMMIEVVIERETETEIEIEIVTENENEIERKIARRNGTVREMTLVNLQQL